MTIYLREIPADLVEAIDEYAEKNSGPGGRPSRNSAAQYLIRRGLAEATRVRGSATQRGEGDGGTRRGE